jgi:hypothetical protein
VGKNKKLKKYNMKYEYHQSTRSIIFSGIHKVKMPPPPGPNEVVLVCADMRDGGGNDVRTMITL